MSTNRIYTEKEIAEIFRQAAQDQETWKEKSQIKDGLSLDELQRIGSEVGITPEFVARAAALLDESPEVTRKKTFLSIPLSVSKTIRLPKRISEEEWEQLVVDLRQAFQQEGALSQEGSFRKWTSKGVNVLAEPTQNGYQINLSSSLEDIGVSQFTLILGIASLLMGIFFWVLMLLFNQLSWSIIGPGTVFSILGVIAMIPLFLSPNWARQEEAKLDNIVRRLKSRMSLDKEGIQSVQESDPPAVEGTISLDPADQDRSEQEDHISGRAKNRNRL